MDEVIETELRGTRLRLVGRTRALRLCARLNRELEVFDFIDRIAPGEVLYDLGACEGRFALYAALRGVRCYAFEPERMNYQVLLENIAHNGQTAGKLLVPLPYAVGETGHRTTIKIAQPWAGGHQKVVADVPSRVDLDFDFTVEEDVVVVALDEFIAEANLPQPNYLKVDIDGSEVPFVRGARDTLNRPQLKRIIFELCRADPSCAEVTSFLGACGFAPAQRHEVEPGLFNVLFERSGER